MATRKVYDFVFKGEHYDSLRGWGKAIAAEYFPGKDTTGWVGNDYNTLFTMTLDTKGTDDLVKDKGVASMYNYCRAYYAVAKAPRVPTARLLDMYFGLRSKEDKTLHEAYIQEGIHIYIDNLRRGN